MRLDLKHVEYAGRFGVRNLVYLVPNLPIMAAAGFAASATRVPSTSFTPSRSYPAVPALPPRSSFASARDLLGSSHAVSNRGFPRQS